MFGSHILCVSNDDKIIHIQLQCLPLGSLILALGNPTVNYLSLDLEGAEMQAPTVTIMMLFMIMTMIMMIMTLLDHDNDHSDHSVHPDHLVLPNHPVQYTLRSGP